MNNDARNRILVAMQAQLDAQRAIEQAAKDAAHQAEEAAMDRKKAKKQHDVDLHWDANGPYYQCRKCKRTINSRSTLESILKDECPGYTPNS